MNELEVLEARAHVCRAVVGLTVAVSVFMWYGVCYVSHRCPAFEAQSLRDVSSDTTVVVIFTR